MLKLKKLAKLFLCHFTSPLIYLKKIIRGYLKGKDRVLSLILHDIPENKTDYFKRLLLQLKNEYEFLNPEDFISVISGNLHLRDTHRLLTFDDGFYSNYFAAKKILCPLGIYAIFFIPTGFIDAKDKIEQKQFVMQNINNGEICPNINDAEIAPMNWENLSELIASGHLIGSHTKNHLRLSKIDSLDLLHEEIISSGDRIEEMLGINVEHFAFPFGDIGSINKKAIKVAGTRYKYVYSGIRGGNSYPANSLSIRRESLNISDEIGYNTFVAGGGLSFYYWRARRRLDSITS